MRKGGGGVSINRIINFNIKIIIWTCLVFHSDENRLVLVNNRTCHDGLASNGIQHQRFFRMVCSVHHRYCAMANQCSMVSMNSLLVSHGHGYRPFLKNFPNLFNDILEIIRYSKLEAILCGRLINTFEWSDIWLPEFGFFAWCLITTDHLQMLLKHDCVFVVFRSL